MSLYNCFSNKQLNYVNIDYRYNGENYSFNNNDGSKVYSIPIRPYNTYTIFLDCMAPVDMIACYYASNDVQDYKFGETKSNTYPYFLTRMTKANLSFNNPFIYDKLSEESLNGDNHNIDWDLVKDKFMYEHRGQLRLLIKIPAENNSSIVVLEGDYTQNSDVHFSNNTLCLTENIYGIPLDKETGETLSHYDAIDVVSNYYSLSSYNVSKLNDGDIIKVLTDETRDSTTTYYEYKLLFKGYEFRYLRTQEFNSKIGLAKIQSGVNHPFSDRLLEYLFNSVISSDDSINKNIARVQKALKGGVRVSKATVYGRDLGLSGV